MNTDNYEVTSIPAVLFDFDAGSEWCRDIQVVDKALVEGLISAATAYIENATNRILMERTFKGSFSGYQSSSYENYDFVEIRRSPLISVESITINGELLTSSDYIIKNNGLFSRILFASPITLDADLAYPIEIDFTAGYENSIIGVPDAITSAVKQLVLFWYENRGDVSTDAKQTIPFVVRPIIKQYRIVNTY